MAGSENGDVCIEERKESHHEEGGILPSDEERTRKPVTGRAMRPEGQRNLQDSTFSISHEVEEAPLRSSIRVCNPPGGKSSGGFW
jgi:dihydropyrimidinase